MDNISNSAHHIGHGGEYPLTNNQQPNQTNAQQVRKQNQQSMQKQSQYQNNFGEEFGSETDVEQVKKQNQQSEANKFKASGQRANQFENGSR